MRKSIGFILLGLWISLGARAQVPYEVASGLDGPHTAECASGIGEAKALYLERVGVLNSASGVSVGQMANGAAGASGLQVAQVDTQATGSMALMNQAAVLSIRQAASICRQGCMNSASSIEAKISAASSSGNAALVMDLQSALARVKTAGESCFNFYEAQVAAAQSESVVSAAALKNALETKNDLTIGKVFYGEGVTIPSEPTWMEKAGTFVRNNWGKMALGLGVGYMVKSSSDRKAEQKKMEEVQKEAAKAAIACTADNAVDNSQCAPQLKSDCAKMVNLGSTRCKNFTTSFCGSNDGIGTQLCKDALAKNYCDNSQLASQRASCYSCRDLVSRGSDVCTARPDLCMHENSLAEMAQWKATCPDDPVFTDPRWAGVKAATSVAASLRESSVNSSVSRKPADISSTFSASSLSQASSVIQQLCEAGHLNDCGSRTGIIK